jgi:LPXTG-site transpeptidase (sortase) family protein
MYYNKKSLNVKNLKWSFLRIAIVVVGIFVAGFSITTLAKSDRLATLSYSAVQVDEVAEKLEWIPELPVRLVIPAINVDAKVQHVGQVPNGNGEMDVPSNFTDVAWYQDGVRPGMKGSAVIAGHFNGKDTPEAVFYDLHTLEIGDEVVIMSENRIEDIYQVVKIDTYNYDDPTAEVFASSDGKARLNLITCGGDWLSEEELYDKRTVVFTELSTNVE